MMRPSKQYAKTFILLEGWLSLTVFFVFFQTLLLQEVSSGDFDGKLSQ